MAGSTQRKRAFTIVELLVTITIIGLLVGLLLPALAGVKRQSRKRTEANLLKQVHLAWTLYGQNSNDAALPGYLDTAVQAPRVTGVSRGWGLRAEFPDQSLVPPAPSYLPGDPNAAGPWSWRLIKYLDYTTAYFENYQDSALAAGLPYDDNESMISLNSGAANPDAIRFQRAHAMAESPIFGYNGYYIGGVWKMHPGEGGVATPRFDYFDHCDTVNLTRVTVPTSIGQIRRSTEVITFCAATRIDTVGYHGNMLQERPGTHLVTPPFMGTVAQWNIPAQGTGNTADAGGGDVVEVLSMGVLGNNGSGGTHAGVPFPRFGGGTACLFADGHVDQQQYNALADMRRWVDSATTRNYQHDAICP